jgi:TBC1 domain family member 20
LRDCTREVLDAVTESLDLLHVLVAKVDRSLALHYKRTQLHPHYFISWMITWFAHHVDSALLPRLFDLFLASHPLMPMYLYVVAMCEVRFSLAYCTCSVNAFSFEMNIWLYANDTS